MTQKRTFKCLKCQHTWDVPFGTGRPTECPACKDVTICRSEVQRGRRRLGAACPRGRS
jgi:transcription elongation factor Elf1